MNSVLPISRTEVGKAFLHGFVHDDEIGCGDERHECRNQGVPTFFPMINAGVSVGQLLGSDVGDDVFRAVEKFRSPIFGHDFPRTRALLSQLHCRCRFLSMRHPDTSRTVCNWNRNHSRGNRSCVASCPKTKHATGRSSVNLRNMARRSYSTFSPRLASQVVSLRPAAPSPTTPDAAGILFKSAPEPAQAGADTATAPVLTDPSDAVAVKFLTRSNATTLRVAHSSAIQVHPSSSDISASQ